MVAWLQRICTRLCPGPSTRDSCRVRPREWRASRSASAAPERRGTWDKAAGRASSSAHRLSAWRASTSGLQQVAYSDFTLPSLANKSLLKEVHERSTQPQSFWFFFSAGASTTPVERRPSLRTLLCTGVGLGKGRAGRGQGRGEEETGRGGCPTSLEQGWLLRPEPAAAHILAGNGRVHAWAVFGGGLSQRGRVTAAQGSPRRPSGVASRPR